MLETIKQTGPKELKEKSCKSDGQVFHVDFLYHGVLYECADHWESCLTGNEYVPFVNLNILCLFRWSSVTGVLLRSLSCIL